jgi:DNA-binding CsgD family transcriptional regulator
MPHIDVEILTPFAAKYLTSSTLTRAERAEVLRMAQGFTCKDSAGAGGVSPETIRARRKRIYRKLELSGVNDLISSLLALSLAMLARGERIELAAAGEASAAQPQRSGDALAAGGAS